MSACSECEERENKHRGRKGHGTQKDKMSPRRIEWTKWIRLCLAGVLYDWQAYPDQTKAIKGQNSKTLVTAGTIKRPLPCPVERRGKIGDLSQRKRKKQSKRKRKRD